MKKIITFIINLQFIFRPSYWIMNNPYSKKWDEELNLLLNEHIFLQQDEFTATLGDHEIWVANHPYSSFTPYSFRFNGKCNFRASRITILKASKKLKKDCNIIKFDPYDNYKSIYRKYVD